MPAFSFEQLARELRAAGAAPSVIARTCRELKEHYADATAAALDQGLSVAAARRQAMAGLGSPEAIVAAVAARSALLDWRHRWPQSAHCVDSVAYFVALPVAPFVYCASHPAALVRWGLSSTLAVCVTASILFTLQWLIN
jgi:hypothetical protein